MSHNVWFAALYTTIAKINTALWARITKNTDWSTGPLARPFTCSLAPLTRLLAPHYSLRSRAPLCSLARLHHSLAHFAHFAHSLARGMIRRLFILCFFSILAHSLLWLRACFYNGAVVIDAISNCAAQFPVDDLFFFFLFFLFDQRWWLTQFCLFFLISQLNTRFVSRFLSRLFF